CSCFAFKRGLTAVNLMPGASTDLVAILASMKTDVGRFKKVFTLESDDLVAPKVTADVVGTIVDVRTVTPSSVWFGAVDVDEPAQRTVEIRGGKGFHVTVADAKAADPRLEVETKTMDGDVDLVVRTKKGAAKGVLQSRVDMTLDVTSVQADRPPR